MDDDTAPNKLFIKEHPTKGEQWCCIWSDHAERQIKRWLGPSTMRKAKARRLAAEEYEKYAAAHDERLAQKKAMTLDELDEMRQHCTFPRAVVAFHITRICRRIAQVEDQDERRDERKGNPGIQVFAEQTGISTREVHRLIEDRERIAVGYDTVDKICTKFHMIFDDFIADSQDWAELRGMWAHRNGTEDSWPVGYKSAQSKEPNLDPFDPMMEVAHSGFEII